MARSSPLSAVLARRWAATLAGRSTVTLAGLFTVTLAGPALAAFLTGIAFQAAMADQPRFLAQIDLAQADAQSLPVPHIPQAKAQPAPTNCGDKPEITETFGIVTFKLTNACRRLTPLSIEADGVRIGATFDTDGLAEIRFPLFHDHAEIAWPRDDGSLTSEPVAFTGFKEAVRVALVWRSHVALALHVVEPGAMLASPSGHVRIEETGATGVSEFGAEGVSLIDAEPIGNLEAYSLPADGNPGKGLLNYYVEFVSRGAAPTGFFCGDGALASPNFEVWILRYGQLQKFDHGIAAAPCNKALNDKVKIQKLGDVSLSPN